MQKIEVPLRTLNDGNKIPVLTFGAGTRWKTEGNCNFVQEGVIQAVQLGFTSIDNAEIYNTEKEVGHALNSLSPLDRNRLFISSKVLKNLDNIEQACRESLRNLNLDYLDLYLIHSPFFKNFCSTVSLEEAWLKMELLVEKGLVKSIGVSNFRVQDLRKIMSVATIVPCLNQIEFHPYLQQTEIVDFCHKNNILVAGYSVLTTLFRKPGGPIDSLVMALSKKYSKTPNQILYQWLLQHNAVIITTSGNKDRLKEALEIFSESKFKLDEVDFYKINSVGKELEYRRFWSQEDWS